MGELLSESKKYSEADVEKLIGEATKRGAVLAILHFDSHGKDAETVKNALVEFIGRISNEGGVLYCRGEVESAMEVGDLYSSSAEVKMLLKSFNDLVNIGLKYGPFAVEVIKPDRIVLGLDEAQNIVVDASTISQDYAKFIHEKTLQGGDLERFHKQLAARAEFGKKLVERG